VLCGDGAMCCLQRVVVLFYMHFLLLWTECISEINCVLAKKEKSNPIYMGFADLTDGLLNFLYFYDAVLIVRVGSIECPTQVYDRDSFTFDIDPAECLRDIVVVGSQVVSILTADDNVTGCKIK
jgi:hypothetical protein